MNGHDLLWYLIVGLVTGWVSSLLVQGRGMGIVRDMAIGIVGPSSAGSWPVNWGSLSAVFSAPWLWRSWARSFS